MKNNPFQPRFVLAFFLGIGALIFLLALMMNGGSSLLSKKPPVPQVIITTGTVKPNQTLASILTAHQVASPIVYKVQQAMKGIYDLKKIHINKSYEIVTSTSGIFKEFRYHESETDTYEVERSSMGVYTSHHEKRKTVWMEKTVHCTVDGILYNDLIKSGYSPNFVAKLIGVLGDNIFAWRIDFFTEQRKGDKLSVLLLEEYPAGSDKPVSGALPKILAASYTGTGTRKKENAAIRYTGPGQKHHEYFDEKGKAVRKAFLRAPFTHRGFRISSRYNPKRYHPIKRVWRPHHGTDYAAPTGTRVAAVGGGTVIRAEWNGGYGKCIDIRHSRKYTTRYGHLSRIGVKKGQKVAQGQYIGKVGSTGLSTGPHLHFELIVDGRKRDFHRMDFPSVKSVSAGNMKQFYATRDEYLSRLFPEKKLASSEESEKEETN